MDKIVAIDWAIYIYHFVNMQIVLTLSSH